MGETVFEESYKIWYVTISWGIPHMVFTYLTGYTYFHPMKSPKKKIIVVSFIAILIVLIGYAILKISEKKVTYQAPSPLSAVGSATPTARLIEDSDGDGLADWEEMLWKTDPANPDTDGDGVSDGDEVRDSRDPLVMGAGDLSGRNSIASSTTGKLSSTEKLSLDLLLTYAALKQQSETGGSGKVPTPEEFLKENEVAIPAPVYPLSRFTTVADSPESIAVYAKEFLAVLSKNLPQDSKNELVILSEALQKSDKGGAKKLTDVANHYRAATLGLLDLTVPRGALTLHAEFVNALSAMAESINALGDVLTDPIKGMSAMNMYKESSSLVVQRLSDLDAYVTDAVTQSTAP